MIYKALDFGVQEILADTFECFLVTLVRFVSKPGTLLNGECDIWLNHGLKIRETAENCHNSSMIEFGEGHLSLC